jgi:endonuclease YncB( thermonuclease family)
MDNVDYAGELISRIL